MPGKPGILIMVMPIPCGGTFENFVDHAKRQFPEAAFILPGLHPGAKKRERVKPLPYRGFLFPDASGNASLKALDIASIHDCIPAREATVPASFSVMSGL